MKSQTTTDMAPRENSLQENDFQFMIENSPDYIIKVNLTGHYTYVNPAFCKLYGINAQNLLGRHYSVDVVEEDKEMVEQFFKKLFIPPHTVSFTHKEHTVNGIRRLEWKGNSLINGKGDLVEFIGIARDVTEHLELIDHLTQQADHDHLTGLANRRFLMRQANLELERAKRYQYPFSVFMLDIDHFKNINDEHGHSTGDVVLKQLSSLMKAILRESDFITRFGGEEFAVLLPESDLEAAILIADRLRQAVQNYHFRLHDDLVISLTISIGIACAKEAEYDFEQLIQKSDERLYQAKLLGRNQVIPAKIEPIS
ncbi:sensor domain-containing diguanylate cyclase [Methylotenera sp. L2L1]|uniref:sensor domain-containing diguanylate cyclase n=1 Tax=Methylotenera sp. L2L1 TaxID=1502770 RepID=UPI0006906D51|nr:sensor domain-containing diguanylate cyclase [Methylotenera sp. L2L1]